MGLRRLLAGAFACATVALLVHCKEPTQILVEVRIDDCSVRDTGIAVGNDLEDVENRDISSFTGYEGCAKPGVIGTLYVSPSGAKNATIAFKVYTGVATIAADCKNTKGAGCIEQKGTTEFIPGATHHVIVKLSKKCLSAICPIQTTCIDGACYDPNDVTPEGDTLPDAGKSEAGFNEGGPPSDAGPDAADGGTVCTGCKGACDPGATNPACIVDCGMGPGKVDCTKGNVCAPTIPCTVTCDKADECKGLQCNTQASCTIDCNASHACNGASCKVGGSCHFRCNADDSCDGDQTMSLDAAGSSVIDCGNGSNGGCRSGSKFVCRGGSCNLNCSGPACPGDAKCCATNCGNNFATSGPNGCN